MFVPGTFLRPVIELICGHSWWRRKKFYDIVTRTQAGVPLADGTWGKRLFKNRWEMIFTLQITKKHLRTLLNLISFKFSLFNPSQAQQCLVLYITFVNYFKFVLIANRHNVHLFSKKIWFLSGQELFSYTWILQIKPFLSKRLEPT